MKNQKSKSDWLLQSLPLLYFLKYIYSILPNNFLNMDSKHIKIDKN